MFLLPIYQEFEQGIGRARTLCGIEEYLTNTHAGILDYSDILRSSVVLAVSCLDSFMHALFVETAVFRMNQKKSVSRFQVPFAALISDPGFLEQTLRQHVHDTNAYKSFVAPDKIAEALSCFVEQPWAKIAAELGQTEQAAKARLRDIIDWRNRIAHNADRNPDLGGIALWSIHRPDVIAALDDLALQVTAIRKIVEAA